MTKLVGALCAVLLWTGCGGQEEQVTPEPTGVAEAGLSTPVVFGSLPGLSNQTAREIAAQNFNAVSPWVAYYQHTPDQMNWWAYGPEGFYYIESYTWIEQCGGRVYANGTFVHEYCFMRSYGP